MLIQCSNCKEMYESKTRHQVNWCHKPECRKARIEHKREVGRANDRKHAAKPNRCRSCGGPVTGRGELWCKLPECREHRDRHLQKQKRRWDKEALKRERIEAEGYRIAKGEKVSLCRECGCKTPNRLGLCDRCRREWMEREGFDCMVGNMANAIYDVTEYWPRREGASA